MFLSGGEGDERKRGSEPLPGRVVKRRLYVPPTTSLLDVGAGPLGMIAEFLTANERPGLARTSSMARDVALRSIAANTNVDARHPGTHSERAHESATTVTVDVDELNRLIPFGRVSRVRVFGICTAQRVAPILNDDLLVCLAGVSELVLCDAGVAQDGDLDAHYNLARNLFGLLFRAFFNAPDIVFETNEDHPIGAQAWETIAKVMWMRNIRTLVFDRNVYSDFTAFRPELGAPPLTARTRTLAIVGGQDRLREANRDVVVPEIEIVGRNGHLDTRELPMAIWPNLDAMASVSVVNVRGEIQVLHVCSVASYRLVEDGKADEKEMANRCEQLTLLNTGKLVPPPFQSGGTPVKEWIVIWHALARSYRCVSFHACNWMGKSQLGALLRCAGNIPTLTVCITGMKMEVAERREMERGANAINSLRSDRVQVIFEPESEEFLASREAGDRPVIPHEFDWEAMQAIPVIGLQAEVNHLIALAPRIEGALEVAGQRAAARRQADEARAAAASASLR